MVRASISLSRTAAGRGPLVLALAGLAGWLSGGAWGQAPLPILPPPGAAQVRTVADTERLDGGALPQEQGQVWREYDIRPYTRAYPQELKPEQTMVDWILRETGTELWFSEPLGILSADRERLRVYHTPAIQDLVESIVERFLRPQAQSYLFGVRMVTLASPNWRARAVPRLTPVTAQTPGVEAWLLSHEDAAVVLSELRRRTDFREHNSPNLLIRNGESHAITRTRPVSYVRGVRSLPGGWGGSQMDMGQVEEGFTLRLSPLIAMDGRHVDAVIKIESHQVERLKPVSVAAPTPQNPRQTAEIQVPQTSSWRLHERFHWPADEVLLISCGVVAAPGPERKSVLGWPEILPQPPRADALLFLDAKGRSGESAGAPLQQAQGGSQSYRGRY